MTEEYIKHPALSSAIDYVAKRGMPDLLTFREACASTAIEGNELGAVLADTINRILNREPVGERFIFALAFELMRMERNG